MPIPQPPHSTGRPFPGLRSRIDPSQIPSPVTSWQADQEIWDESTFMTCASSQTIPSSNSEYVAIDQGNSAPRFIRLSTYSVPFSHDLASGCNLPIAAMIQPFAQQPDNEAPVPVVDFGEAGPPRCHACRGYINPWCTWTSAGQRWICNLCQETTEVPQEYFATLEVSGQRVDHASRPELNHGTIDFIVPKEYWAQPPPPRLLSSTDDPADSPSRATFLPNLQQPPPPSRKPTALHMVFGIDVSAESISSGLAQSLCAILKQCIFAGDPETGVKYIGIIAYDTNAVYFFDLSPDLSQPKMLVVPDIESMFVPLRTGLFVDPYASRNLVEGLLDMIPTYFGSAISGGATLGAAVQAGLSALQLPTGGQILLFQRSHPSDLPERTKPEQELAGTDKERILFAPESLKWTELAEECAEAGVAVSTWLFPTQFVDIATIGSLSLKTGGDIHFHPRFLPERDHHVVCSEVSRVLTRPMGYNCSMRVRCSKGLSVSTHLGAFHESSPSDLTIASSHGDNSVLTTFTHSGRLDDRREAHIQCATLHTTRTGERRVRVLNIATQVSTLAGNVFKNADLEVVCCTFSREALQMMSQRPLAEIRESISEKCAALLLAYRRNCAASTSPTQLILPEAFKTLPIYALGLLKTRSLKGSNVISDVRNYHAIRLTSMNTSATMRHLYPRMTAIHDLSPTVGFPSPQTGRLVLPSPMPSSYTRMEPHGVYMIVADGSWAIENGDDMYIWIGDGVSPQILIDLFNVENWDEIGPRTYSLPELQTHLSVQVRNLITHGNLLRGRVLPLHVVRQNMDGAELEFSNLLVEDTNNDAMSYVDYLCYEHKQINQALVNGTNIGSNGWRIPW
ncbi:Protein transport protein sec24 [Ceratobasidium theobromae]|uniref:Protein transport protein sec24 n=1 Tax=Ceratobasidium theobromae TaxID=1582974 RepID=A0A5N5QKS9_9AGAM|nr:Protein transport protein sec24 [Ceratobasidium theobromae]